MERYGCYKDKDIFELKIWLHISRDISNKSHPKKIWLLHEDLAPQYKGYTLQILSWKTEIYVQDYPSVFEDLFKALNGNFHAANIKREIHGILFICFKIQFYKSWNYLLKLIIIRFFLGSYGTSKNLSNNFFFNFEFPEVHVKKNSKV